MIELIEQINRSTSQFDSSNVQLFLEAIVNGNGENIIANLTNSGGTSVIENLLEKSGLDQGQQQAIIYTLMGLKGDSGQDEKTVIEETSFPSVAHDEVVVDDSAEIYAADTNENISSLLQELEELQIVNDTFAAAVGACPYCWGGDNECSECEGEGYAGSAVPDMELFEEFIAPAVSRVRIMKRSENKRSGYKRR